MANFGPLAAEIDAVVWGTPTNFIGFCVLAALKPNSITLASSELAPNMFTASSDSELRSLFAAGSKLKFGLSSSLLAAN